MLLVVSAQLNLFREIYAGREINPQARALDFVHWLLLIFMNIGSWLQNGSTIWWYILKVVLLAIIAFQIALSIKRKWAPSASEKALGLAMVTTAVVLGLLGGYVRAYSNEYMGAGWLVEVVGAVVATLLVIWWVGKDMVQIRKNAKQFDGTNTPEEQLGYPRSFFIKGILSNSLVLWHWVNLLYISKWGPWASETWIHNFGLTFNVIVGNLVFIVYYGVYEYYLRDLKSRGLPPSRRPGE